MKTRVLESDQFLKRPIEEVFAFFSDAFNLEQITPPWLCFEVLTPQPIAMQVGTLIDYRLRLHGIPIRWRTQISGWDPPHRFVDEQLRGPYLLWHHEHTFEAIDGGTRIRDLVTYRSRGWILEPVVHALWVARDLRAIFEFRRQKIREVFGEV